MADWTALHPALRAFVAGRLRAFADGRVPPGAGAEELARERGWRPDAVGRLLAALAAAGAVAPAPGWEDLLGWLETGEAADLKTLPSLGRAGLRDDPDAAAVLSYYRGAVGPFMSPEPILAALRTGRGQAAAALGLGGDQIFDHYGSDSSLLATYARAFSIMNRGSDVFAAALLSLPQDARVLDVGGGAGGLAAAVVRAHPSAFVTIYDHPHSRAVLEAEQGPWLAGLETRVSRAYGDLFVGAGPGLDGLEPGERYDLVCLGWILHDWDDAQCAQVLSKASRHLKKGGRLAILEKLRPEGQSVVDLIDFVMLVMAGGRERTLAQYLALASASGLEIEKTHSNPSGRDLALARRLE